MKKLFILSVVLLGLESFAQKTVTFDNASSVTIGIGEIKTIRKISSGPNVYGYPYFTNKNSNRGGAYLTIAPGVMYTLENLANPGKFPFVSVGNTPPLTFWDRQNSVSSVTANVSDTTAFIIASTQLFHYVKFGKYAGGTVTDGTTFSNQSATESLSSAGVGSYEGIDYGAMILSDEDAVYILFY